MTKKHFGITLYQIEALKDFGNVKKGDKGGFIEKEENLSQEGTAWVTDHALVTGHAKVTDHAWVTGHGKVTGHGRVTGHALVTGNVLVTGNLKLKSGYFYHFKNKSEKIEKVEIDDNYELLAYNPVYEK